MADHPIKTRLARELRPECGRHEPEIDPKQKFVAAENRRSTFELRPRPVRAAGLQRIVGRLRCLLRQRNRVLL
jgi:hypothetical protein